MDFFLDDDDWVTDEEDDDDDVPELVRSVRTCKSAIPSATCLSTSFSSCEQYQQFDKRIFLVFEGN